MGEQKQSLEKAIHQVRIQLLKAITEMEKCLDRAEQSTYPTEAKRAPVS